MDNQTASSVNWGTLFILGILLVIVGILAIFSPLIATFISVFVFGWFLFAAGIVQIIYAFLNLKSDSFLLHLLAAILTLVIGILLLAYPTASLFALTVLIAALFFSIGIFRILVALIVRFQGWGWVLLNGLIAILLGVLIVLHLPTSALWVIGLFIGIDLLFAGFSYIMAAIYCKNMKIHV
ncbi:MAG: HdeD family acid-resistance protein [Pseudomonadota bacterium]